jgi:hypothetical protein
VTGGESRAYIRFQEERLRESGHPERRDMEKRFQTSRKPSSR